MPEAPHFEEHADFAGDDFDRMYPEYQEMLQKLERAKGKAALRAHPRLGDKLGGWPYWPQTAHYPKCKKCKNQMSLLFQFSFDEGDAWTNVHFPHFIAADGKGFIFQCEKHLAELKFHFDV